MKKKKWVDFEITKVKLNPEQAVLSCCDSTDKSILVEEYQCTDDSCGAHYGSASVSS